MSKAIDNEELRKLIAERPDLPLVFEVFNDEVCCDYNTTIFEGCRSRIGTVWFDDEQMYDDEDDVIEEWIYKYGDDEKYKDMSDDEIEEEFRKLVNEEVRHYEAIIVRVG